VFAELASKSFYGYRLALEKAIQETVERLEIIR
jgi:hypothetical protein